MAIGANVSAVWGGADEGLPNAGATVSLCDAFPAGGKLRNEVGTNRGRIADSLESPVPFTQHVAGPPVCCTRWSFARPHKRRCGGGFVKAGDGVESNQNRGGVKWIRGWGPAKAKRAKTTPCTVGKWLEYNGF